jgi:calcium and integrin-binding protein 1
MGQSVAKIAPGPLSEFERSTFFTGSEILKFYDKFEGLGGSLEKSVTSASVCSLPELKHNPFRYRICEVFGDHLDDGVENANAVNMNAERPRSSSQHKDKEHKDKDKDMKDAWGMQNKDSVVLTFANFLQLMNAFSPRASQQVKAYWAFKIYDFDGDKFINTEDIVTTLATTIGRGHMSAEKLLRVANSVLDEADLDGNHKLSRTEFNRVIKRIPDFMSKFQFSID